VIIREYTHSKIDDEVKCLAGQYTFLKEARISYLNREVLYAVVQLIIDNSCCGGGRWQHALVYGYVLNWQSRTNSHGFPVTEVEPITNPADRENIRQIIQQIEFVSQIDFR
jgi:hypothetical protein